MNKQNLKDKRQETKNQNPCLTTGAAPMRVGNDFL